MNRPTLNLQARRAAVLAEATSTVDVLISLQAPQLPEARLPERQPLFLALVIDRSGSMSGAPLEHARLCADFVVDGLRPDDQVTIISYDQRVTTNWPLGPATDKASIHRAIADIQAGGATDLHGGWLEGVEQLAPHARPGRSSRVILLSDGVANRGQTRSEAMARQCAELAEAGVTTSTYGLGRNFNEDLMVAMADSGQGNSYYGETAEDLMDPFREELALLNALCAQRIDLEIDTPPGVSVEILNQHPSVAPGVCRLPDLAFAGETWALARLTVEHGMARTTDDLLQLMTARARWQDPEGHQETAPAVDLKLPPMPAAAYAAVAEHPRVAERVQELAMANLHDAARVAARHHDWRKVESILSEAAAIACDHPWLRQTLGALQAIAARRDATMMSKEALYASSRMRKRLAASEEAPDRLTPDYLRRKVRQGKAERPD